MCMQPSSRLGAGMVRCRNQLGNHRAADSMFEYVRMVESSLCPPGQSGLFFDAAVVFK